MSQKSLIVVESPSKARTIEQYLEGEFEVIACVGHVKDLPSNKLGIDIENNFEMTLDILPNRKEFVKELRKKSASAERVYIASDPDREGEAIAAHLASEVPEEKLERVEFTEITKAGVKEGMGNSRKLNNNLISSQKTRRIIDRLVGYKVSPVLWATLQKNMNFVNTTLSAGRVQSACVKILNERDRKRQKYLRTEYFDLKAKLNKNQSETMFEAVLSKVDGKTIVSSNHFDSDTGKIKNSDTFRYMFLEACEHSNLEFDDLSKEFCYSFVLQHPNNRIVTPFNEMKLYLISVFKIEDLIVKSISLKNVKPFFEKAQIYYPENYSFSTFSELRNKYASGNTDYKYVGVMIYDKKNGVRTKFRNPNYEIVRKLRGNQPKKQFRYLVLRQQGKVSEYLKFYSEDKKEFSQFREHIHVYTRQLHQNYIKCFILKENPLKNFPYQYRKYLASRELGGLEEY